MTKMPKDSLDQDTRTIELINKFIAREARYHNDAKERRDVDETYFYSGRVGILEELRNYLLGNWSHGQTSPKTGNQLYEIWSEGFRANGESGVAVLHESIEAPSFKEACLKYAEEDSYFNKYFSAERMTYWGCRLFDNESDARKSFG